jgi:indolepyruvate ferredoxin oxidoreductase
MNHVITLSDKYTLPSGRVYMNGTQALVRLLIAQKARDESAGLKTEGFVSGYRGSPLGAVDQELWKNRQLLEEHKVHFQPGLNEELAATSVWGTQMVSLDPKARVDGVFALWYGKGPGVDRCGDVFKHGNIAGGSQHGGVLLVAGDDHACKSSSLPHQSEHAFIAAMIPVLHPSGVHEFIEFGLHGYAMSRYSGCWVGFKVISDTVESSSSFDIDPMSVDIRIPQSYPIPDDGFSIRWPDPPLEQENRLQRERLYALLEYVRLNKLNRQDWTAPNARLGICTTGKSYLDVREALSLLGLDAAASQELGLRLLKIGVVWPLEPTCVVEFACGLDEILVVEEKRQVLEYQIKEHLYNEPHRPRVVGKYDETGEWVQVPSSGILLSPNGELTPADIADVIAARIAKVFGHDALPTSVQLWIKRHTEVTSLVKVDASLPQRLPYFCSGCPHNTSTQVPEGSRALAGIGCHYMSMWMDRRTETFSQMGGEGVSWIGQAPYTNTPHVFANLGDGTYMHSGSLAIRASVAAGVSITYKLLVNDAVAMTGGQPVEGMPSVPQLLRQIAAEGVKELHLVSDEPELFQSLEDFPTDVKVSHRDNMDALQRQLREVKGVSVIVYAQTCAAEKRRRRKKKTLADPARRVVINEAVCEGCGDCGVQSNCVSILPMETPLGRKRQIDQSGCNKDFSCVRGFCPSFVVLEGAELRKPQRDRVVPPKDLPQPTFLELERPWNILVAGVGGTGVVTIGALMGMAAHIEGKGLLVLDMAGLAQKGGAVVSHIRLAPDRSQLHAARVARGQADVILGCDLMVAAAGDALASMSSGRTYAVMNTDVTPTGSFTRDPNWEASPDVMLERVRSVTKAVDAFEASRLAVALMGDAVATNVFLLGFAWQKGWIPLKEASLLRAIELNGAAVAMNRAAFAWGRQAVVDLAVVRRAAGLPSDEKVMLMPSKTETLAKILKDRSNRLNDYQNSSYARRYEAFIQRVTDAEKISVGGERLAREVAVSLYKLMAYKDEYEVARLHVDSDFLARLQERFEGDFKVSYYLAPPLFSRRDAQGRPMKQRYGAWVQTAFGLLARLRFLRGTAFDPFGWTQERREERAAVHEFEALVGRLLQGLSRDNFQEALELVRLPQQVRGYGHVKAREHQAMLKKRHELMARWNTNASLTTRT